MHEMTNINEVFIMQQCPTKVVGRQLCCHHPVISRFAQKHQQMNEIKNGPRPGWPRVNASCVTWLGAKSLRLVPLEEELDSSRGNFCPYIVGSTQICRFEVTGDQVSYTEKY